MGIFIFYNAEFLRKRIFWDRNFSDQKLPTESFIMQSSFANECFGIAEKSEYLLFFQNFPIFGSSKIFVCEGTLHDKAFRRECLIQKGAIPKHQFAKELCIIKYENFNLVAINFFDMLLPRTRLKMTNGHTRNRNLERICI